MSGPTFQAIHSWKQILSHVGIGMGAASFWRGAWYILDDQLFPDNANYSALSSLALGTAGMAASQGLIHRALSVRQQPYYLKPVARFGALYVVAMSCVLVWRGTWVGWDCVYEHYHNTHGGIEHTKKKRKALEGQGSTPEFHASALDHGPVGFVIKSTDPGHLTNSGLASHVFAILALSAAGVFASVLAPPAAVSVIRDAAIRSSKQRSSSLFASATARAATTTHSSPHQQRALNYFYNHAQRRTNSVGTVGQMDVSHNSNDRVLNFIPAVSDMSSMSLASRRMTTSTQSQPKTGLFRSTTGTFTKGGARLP